MANFNIPVRDYSDEGSTISAPVADAVIDADLTNLFNAFDGVSLGNFGQATLNTAADKDAGPGGASADEFATRKLKYLCRAVDDVNLKKFERELPCPDLTLLTGNTDFADLAAGAGLAFKSDWDANVLSPDGNASTLVSVQVVGRKFRKTRK